MSQPFSEVRYAICTACEDFNSLLRQCKLCGCIMPIKVRFSTSDCPAGKWGKEVSDDT